MLSHPKLFFTRFSLGRPSSKKMKRKMGNRPHICVSVVKGYFAGLNNVGMPLALCVQLQEHELMFSTAQWTMRQSHAGLSILLFWPTSSVKPVPKKWRRRRRKQPAQLHADPRGCCITEKPQVWDERRCTWASFLQGWIPRMDSRGAQEKEKADMEDDSN